MQLKVQVRERIAKYIPNDDEEIYVCGNSGDTVFFDFDSEWTSIGKKTARFISGGEYTDVDFDGNECEIPVLKDNTFFYIGVYVGEPAEKDEKIASTTGAAVQALVSIRGIGAKANPVIGFNYTNEARGYAAEAKASEDNAKSSEDNAKASENSAAVSASNASASATRAETAAGNASTYAQAAMTAKDEARAIVDEIGKVSVDLYDKSLNETGGYWKVEDVANRCIEFAYDGWARTQKFPIDPNLRYIYSGISKVGSTPCATYFNESTSIVGGYFKPETDGEYELENIPSDAKYVSFSLNSADYDTFKFAQRGTNIGEDVEELKNEISDINSIIRTEEMQLYDGTQNDNDCYWKVEEVANRCVRYTYGGWSKTQLFPIYSNYRYVYSGITKVGGTPMATYLDESGTTIAGGYFKAQMGGEHELESIPSNARYVSFSIHEQDYNSFRFVQCSSTLKEEVEVLKSEVEKQSIGYGSLKNLPNASDGKLLIVPSADGGLAYSDTKFWRWAKDNGLATSARAYHTIRISDGAVINSNNCDTVYNIFSITKLLASVVACEHIVNYNATTTIIQSEITSDKSAKLVQAGDTVTLEALLNSSLVQSDNNAANALRRPVGYLIKPDVASNTEAILAFYGKMKELAETLGMTNTEVDLAVISGAAGVRSTAADLCKLLAYAFNTSAKVKSIWGKSSYTISVTGSNPRSWDIASNTTARAKSMIEGFEGGKSGSSDKMGAYAFCWKDENGEAYATALCEMTLATGDMIKDAKYIADEACSLI
jgi:hypothetical protein